MSNATVDRPPAVLSYVVVESVAVTSCIQPIVTLALLTAHSAFVVRVPVYSCVSGVAGSQEVYRKRFTTGSLVCAIGAVYLSVPVAVWVPSPDLYGSSSAQRELLSPLAATVTTWVRIGPQLLQHAALVVLVGWWWAVDTRTLIPSLLVPFW